MTAGATGTASYDWRFDSGRLCLDLMATAEAEPGEGEPLAGAGRLGRWLTGAGLVPAGTPLGEADVRQVERFVELRGALSQLIRAEIDDRYAESALERVNALAAADAPPAPRAVRGADGTLVRALGSAPDCASLLAAIARDAVELLTDPEARAGLRQCQGESCRRVYLDTSRGRRRRWCSSEVCGNRERVARHRRRASVARA
ncbi:CGNR zinc finger domain-containing protein [Streptomyces sp. NPDC056437]|uniref:CGNR zinc finger domain-containing protein n=1 Tax=Streptomyces sp. NPDC056437 TaxID=3345816 RepID=UPI0036AB1FDA